MATSMNVMTEPFHVHPSYGTHNCGSQKTTVQVYNTKNHAIIIKKGTAVARMLATNEVPKMVVTDGAVGTLQTQQLAKKGHTSLLLRRELRSFLKSWSSQASSPGQRRRKKELWTYWPNTMTTSHRKMEKWDALKLPNTRLK